MNKLVNAFGQRKRLDKLDLRSYRASNDSPEKVLFQHTILDAANNHLFFGLSDKNGTSAPEFWFAYEYFYRVRSAVPETWQMSRSVKTTAVDYNIGKKVTTVKELTDNELKAMCFDIQFGLSNIKGDMDSFLRKLKVLRKQIIEENWDQINTFLLSKYPNNTDTLNLPLLEKKRILLSPESPEEVAKLLNIRAAEDKKEKVNADVENTGSSPSSSNV